MTRAIPILYRDDALVVVDKPAGMLVHRTELARDDDVVMMRVRDDVRRHVFPVHRLDRQTSGALVFALDEVSARSLREAFDEGRVGKRYVALVRGTFPEGLVEVDYAIPKKEGGPRVAARTSFVRLATGPLPGIEGATWSFVEARPATGRFHQVRRHLAHLRYPIACDTNYGTGWFNRAVRGLGLARLALHAAAITLPRPGEPLVVEAPLAPDMAAALEVLGGPGEC